MSGVISIAAGERGVIRVFSLDMGPEQVKFLQEPGALDQVLGTEGLDLHHVEIFAVSDLEEMGLIGYLSEGCGVPMSELFPHRPMLETLQGYVMLLRSRAAAGRAKRLTPADAIKLVVTVKEDPTDWSAPPMTAPASSKPHSAGKLPPREARAAARRIGATLFSIVMALIAVVLLVLIF